MNVDEKNTRTDEDNLTFLEQELVLENKRSKQLITPLAMLLVTAILILLYSLLFWSSSIAFKLNDNQFVVKGPLFMGLLSVLLFLEWFCYWFSRKRLYSVLLARIHVVLTCGLCIAFMGTNRSFFKFQEIDSVQASLVRTLLDGEMRFIELGSLTSWVFIAAQAAFLFNWGSGNYDMKKIN